MAELPLIQGSRALVQNAPSPALPQVSFAQQNPQIAYEAEARYQGTLGDVLDRMSRAAFGVASEMSQRAGLQFAAENPLTPEQLQAMSKGDVSNVNLGSPMNVFNAAVRKARAIEVSAHAEVEAREQLVKLMQRAEAGELSTDDVRSQIAALTNGYGSAIAKVDPDASFKYRAAMATVGGRVIEKVAEFEGQKRIIANSVKVERLLTTMQQEIALASTSKMPIDPATGKEMPVTQYIDALKENFIINASGLVGPTAAARYVDKMNKDVNDSMVAAIGQYLNTDPSFANAPNATDRLIRGDAGSASNAFQSLPYDVRNQVIANYRNTRAQRKADSESAMAEAKKREDAAVRELVFQFLDPNTPEDVRVKIGRQVARSSSLSISQMDMFLNPDKRPGDPVMFAKMEVGISTGVYKTIEDIEADARSVGLNGKQTADLIKTFGKGVTMTESEKDARRILRQNAGVPDLVSVFTTDKEKPKFDKNIALQKIMDDLITGYRTENPSAIVPYQDLAQKAIDQYEKTFASQKTREAAIADVRRILENEARKALEKGDEKKASRLKNITIDENLDPADLKNSGLIDLVIQNSLDNKLKMLRGGK